MARFKRVLGLIFTSLMLTNPSKVRGMKTAMACYGSTCQNPCGWINLTPPIGARFNVRSIQDHEKALVGKHLSSYYLHLTVLHFEIESAVITKWFKLW